jgi:hypothetical protein
LLAIKRNLDRKPLADQHFSEELGKVASSITRARRRAIAETDSFILRCGIRHLCGNDRQSDLEGLAAAWSLVDLD